MIDRGQRPGPESDERAGDTRIWCRLDRLLAERGMTLVELAELVDITRINLSKLKNNRAQAVRFSTLAAICDALNCDVGDVLSIKRDT